MISRCELLKRKDGTNMEEFAEHWRTVRGPLELQMAGLRRYDQHLVVDNQHRHVLAGGAIDIDGYSELQFDTYGDMVAGVESLQGRDSEDLAEFAQPESRVLVFAKKVDTRLPQYLDDSKLIKRVSFLNRKEGVSAEDWMREWWEVHSMLVRTMHGYVGYNQNLVIDRLVNGKHVPYEEIPVEGLVEFWFENDAAFQENYASPEFAHTCKHGETFIDVIDTFLMRTEHLK